MEGGKDDTWVGGYIAGGWKGRRMDGWMDGQRAGKWMKASCFIGLFGKCFFLFFSIAKELASFEHYPSGMLSACCLLNSSGVI